MSEKASPSKFAGLKIGSVKSIAESFSFDTKLIDDSAFDVLAKDLNFRLRQLAHVNQPNSTI